MHLPAVQARLCISPTRNMISLGTPNGEYGYQYLDANRYCFVWPANGIDCACSSYNVARYLLSYNQTLQDFIIVNNDDADPKLKNKHYTGAVIDPGQPATYSGVGILVNKRNRVQQFSIHGSLWNPSLNITAKAFQRLFFTDIEGGEPLSSCLDFPSECSVPSDYNELYSPIYFNDLVINYTLSV